MKSEEADVLRAALAVIRAAREHDRGYAGPAAPARTDQMAALLRRAGCHVEVYSFQSTAAAMVLPRCAGVYPLFVNRDAERVERTFALRHELAHVLAGDADGPVYLADDGYMAREERIADLFALADLVPGWWLAQLAGAVRPRALAAEVAQAVAEFAEGWPRDRVLDRVRLRMRLYAQHQV
ncbi:MAG TPA: hypothetical protein VFH27_16840 [Longimicrobiaceae bacterium]|nr:hypothetical protein [Longimicrobiaceae bacterium]